eukprot:366569-Chlamydomonas_euryale.AAC.8
MGDLLKISRGSTDTFRRREASDVDTYTMCIGNFEVLYRTAKLPMHIYVPTLQLSLQYLKPHVHIGTSLWV